jgi:hypothetical protein
MECYPRFVTWRNAVLYARRNCRFFSLGCTDLLWPVMAGYTTTNLGVRSSSLFGRASFNELAVGGCKCCKLAALATTENHYPIVARVACCCRENFSSISLMTVSAPPRIRETAKTGQVRQAARTCVTACRYASCPQESQIRSAAARRMLTQRSSDRYNATTKFAKLSASDTSAASRSR